MLGKEDKHDKHKVIKRKKDKHDKYKAMLGKEDKHDWQLNKKLHSVSVIN